MQKTPLHMQRLHDRQKLPGTARIAESEHIIKQAEAIAVS
jgi:hypothetical protein